jgi:8-oxo-dGTP diphosphatase
MDPGDLDPRHGVSICVFAGSRVLMVQRGKAPGIGLWAPVGGGIEPGESAEAAALRETMEETGVVCRLLGVVGRRLIVPVATAGIVPRPIDLTVFAALHLAGEPVAGDDAAAARFVDRAELMRLPLVAGVLPFIAAARLLHAGLGGAISAMDR